MADRIANVRASIGTDKMQMYLKAWPEFKSAVACHGPSSMYYELERLHTKVTMPYT